MNEAVHLQSPSKGYCNGVLRTEVPYQAGALISMAPPKGEMALAGVKVKLAMFSELCSPTIC